MGGYDDASLLSTNARARGAAAAPRRARARRARDASDPRPARRRARAQVAAARAARWRVVAQKYVSDPFLIDGRKFDLRVYALVTCADPLRVFVYDDGLVRFCTNAYEPPDAKNLRNARMHLTNYAVNKDSENFVRAEDVDKDAARFSETDDNTPRANARRFPVVSATRNR